MMKLLKYELRKTQPVKWVLLCIALAAEVLYLIGLFGKWNTGLTLGGVLLFVMSGMSLLVVGLQSVTVLHQDMNTKQGYMLFMTPHSSWCVLGAKVLECSLSILLMSVFFFALAALDGTLLLEKQGVLREALEKLNQLLRMFIKGEIDLMSVAMVMGYMVCVWLCTVLTAFFADVAVSAVFNGKKHTGFLWIVLFIALNIGIWWLQLQMPGQSSKSLLWMLSGVCLACTALLYVASAWIMERKLSV